MDAAPTPSPTASPVRIMGIVNVTPDSFSDGGRYFETAAAIEHGLEMAEAGADVVDVGGESSRPGAEPVPLEEELRRVVPVVEALAPTVRVSVDTVKPEVARAAAAAGATLVNDVSASLWPVAAECGVGWIAMHRRGTATDMQVDPRYDDVVGEVAGYLAERAALAAEAGVGEIWVDPGIGFGKRLEHNLALLEALDRFVEGPYPVLVGTSRKSMIAMAARRGEGPIAPAEERLAGSLATAVAAALAGVAMVRVHDVAETRQALELVGPLAGTVRGPFRWGSPPAFAEGRT